MDMRSSFENWYSDEGRSPKAVERSSDGYKLIAAQMAWNAWKASATAEREACANVCRKLANGCLMVNGYYSKEMMQAYEYAEADILKRSNAELSGPRPLAAEGSRSNDVLGAERPGKD